MLRGRRGIMPRFIGIPCKVADQGDEINDMLG